MTALARVAEMLHEEGKRFEQHKDGSLVITIDGELNRAIYPVHLYDSSHGLLRGEVWFPQVREHPIQQVEARQRQVPVDRGDAGQQHDTLRNAFMANTEKNFKITSNKTTPINL